MDRFDCIQRHRIIVCKSCKFAVLPSHLNAHLASAKHRFSKAERVKIQQQIAAWPGLLQNEADLNHLFIPRDIPEPFEHITKYIDGKKCNFSDSEGRKCNYICRDRSIKQRHCRDQHQWTNDWKRGENKENRQRAGRTIDRPWKEGVHCQRFFTHGPKQQYFEVQRPETEQADEEDAADKWAQAKAELKQRWQSVKEAEQRVVQEGEFDEVNAWLERTGWHRYLVGLNHDELVQCTAKPDEEEEPVAHAMWQIMVETIEYCQSSVVDRVGIFVRHEAVRTEKQQTRYQPLKPYKEAGDLTRNSKPWQQVLMFFARTQGNHEWSSPEYKFTSRQSAAWLKFERMAVQDAEQKKQKRQRKQSTNEVNGESEEEEEEEDKKLSPAQKSCLRFCIKLLDHQVTRTEYSSPLVCALAVLGVKPVGWKGSDYYPPILSAMIKTSQFMVIQQALEWDREDEESGRKEIGCIAYVQRMMNKFMVRGTHGPMQWMLDLRTYGLKIHYNTTAEGNVQWIEGNKILYKKMEFGMGEFKGMVHGLKTETKRILMQELMFLKDDEQAPKIDWIKLRDDPRNKEFGWNFIKDERNRLEVNGEEWLIDRIGKNIGLRKKFIKRGPNFNWDRGRIEEYMAQVTAFRERILILTHICGGQPSRGPEILSIRHSNTVKGLHRNIFIENGLMVFVSRYHKGYNISGDVKIIHRYLPREIGELLVYYLWLVLPLVQQWEVKIWNKKEMSSHVWPKDPDGTKWTSERLKKVLKRESMAGMGTEMTIQAYREVAIAMSRRYLRKEWRFRMDEDDEDGENEDEWSHIDEQAGHTAHIAGMIYARGIMEMDGVVASKRQKFRESSEAWHSFLGFEEGIKKEWGGGSLKRKRLPFEEEAEEIRFARRKRLRAVNAEKEMKQMMGEKAEFRGIQEQAVKTIMRGESPVVVVMGTGGGKSLMFMLPAWCGKGGMSVVIVPLIALKEDMMRRCRELGIWCEEWNSRRQPDAASIVFVTPESATSESFRTFLNRARAAGRLDRIIIDECHIILNDKMDFRKDMQRLGELSEVGTQMVMLTATLPPCKEPELWKRMNLEADEVKMFRAETSRANVRYEVMNLEKVREEWNARRKLKARLEKGASQGNRGNKGLEERIKVVGEIARKRLERYKDGRMVIYCNSVKEVEELAEELECEGYYHHAENKGEKLKGFMEGKKRMIIATSALGMGVDIADIRVILHTSRPRTLLDYAQESGRAGRDGLNSEAIIIDNGGEVGWKEREEERKLVKRLIEGKIEGRMECRRKILNLYLDGKVEKGCEEKDIKCDVCEKEEEDRGFELDESLRIGFEDGIGSEYEEGSGSGSGSGSGFEEGIGSGFEEGIGSGFEEGIGSGFEEGIGSGFEEGIGSGFEEGIGSGFEEGIGSGFEEGIGSGFEEGIGSGFEEGSGSGSEMDQAEEDDVELRRQDRERKVIGRRGRSKLGKEGLELEELAEMLNKMRGRCGYCLKMGKDGVEHGLYGCLEEGSLQAREICKMLKKTSREKRLMENYSGCMRCFCPQEWCNRWEQM